MHMLGIISLVVNIKSNPGYIKKEQKASLNNMENFKELEKLFEYNSSLKICPECQIVRPIRSKHCDFC